jgi:hypothetical protein
MNDDSETRFRELEKKQAEHDMAIDRLVNAVESVRQSTDEIKGYAKNIVATIVVTGLTTIVGGVVALIWIGLKVALQVPVHG